MRYKMDELYQLYWKNSASAQQSSQDEQLTEMQNAKCHACEEAILGGNDKYLNYFPGQVMVFIYRECKKALQFKLRDFPIISDNLSRYDIHLFLKQLGPNFSVAVPSNKELYILITKRIVEG